MKYYCAPLEGLTDYTFRQVHHKYFPGTDRYYSPFLATTQNRVFSPKEFKESIPEHNEGITLVPQLLGKNAGDFLWTARELQRMGYEEVNLNLGCPSGTVVAKGKGSGMLADPAALDAFLAEIFSHIDMKLSVKTRLGIEEPDEFWPILAVYNKYPIAELTIHPRTRRQMYKGKVYAEHFARALAESKNPVCCNGDITTLALGQKAEAAFPGVTALMIGRGLVADPALIRKMQGGPGATAAELKGFFAELFELYKERFGSAKNALSRMKGIWFYTIHLFEDDKKYAKRIAKAAQPSDYQALMQTIFTDLVLRPDALDVP